MRAYDFYKSIDIIKQDTKDTLNGSWGIVAKKTTLFFLLCILSSLITIIPSILNPVWYLIVPLSILSICLIGLLWYGYQVYILNLTSKMQAKTKDLFAGFGKKSFKLIILLVSKFFTILFGFMLLIVFGFVFDLSFSMSAFALSENPTYSAVDSMKQSKRLMKENKFRLFKLYFSTFAWLLLCLTGIGSIWALPYLITSKAVFYLDLKTEF